MPNAPFDPARPYSAPALQRRRLPAWLPYLASPLLAVAAWQGLAPAALSPSGLAEALLALAGGAGLYSALAHTGGQALAGLWLGLLGGGALGVAAGLSQAGRWLLLGPLKVLNSVPLLAFLPLLLGWAGAPGARWAMALAAALPISAALARALRGTHPELLEAGHTLRLNRWQQAWHIRLPAAVPALLRALRRAWLQVWLVLLALALHGSEGGVGALLGQPGAQGALLALLLYTALAGAGSLALHGLQGWAQRRGWA
ncbi:ABC transporter permease subunit [Pseudomonas sp. NPDC007930]|uniref:ABC transporter permease subunit n=1 Tax=Pseudomonas sp. NPDC007930 TaxID=3364417 RepID=UPI0036EC9749